MEDREIIDLYWTRSQQAIPETDAKYGVQCRGLSARILKDARDAEECVNDTWLRAWNTMPPQLPQSLRAYLLKIIRNLSIDRWRADRSTKRGGGAEELALELEDCLPPGPSAEEVSEARETAAALERWLVSLEREDRVLFLRRYWFGDPVKELARRRGCTPGYMAKRLFRLRNSLRQALEKEGVLL